MCIFSLYVCCYCIVNWQDWQLSVNKSLALLHNHYHEPYYYCTPATPGITLPLAAAQKRKEHRKKVKLKT